MSRKATITQEEIVNAAFKITKKEGFDKITSRRLAAAAAKMVKDPARLKELETGALEEKVSEAAAEILYANTEKSSEYSHSVNVRRIGEIGLER